jgi:YegS/Rv2252/BmrU family lipid kinase
MESLLRSKLLGSLAGIERTEYPGHATGITRRSVTEGVDTVVGIGGDGTANEILNGLVGTAAALAMIPSGTANDLASCYDLPSDVAEACDVILARNVRRIDVISVDGWYYATAGGIGLPCSALTAAEAFKHHGSIGRSMARMLGAGVYALALLYALANSVGRGYRISVASQQGAHSVDAAALVIANQKVLGKHFKMSPEACVDDGKADVCLVEDRSSRMRLLGTAITALNGRHMTGKGVKTFQAESLTLSASRAVPFFGDVEIRRHGTEFTIRVVPGGLNMVVPSRMKEHKDVV